MRQCELEAEKGAAPLSIMNQLISQRMMDPVAMTTDTELPLRHRERFIYLFQRPIMHLRLYIYTVCLSTLF